MNQRVSVRRFIPFLFSLLVLSSNLAFATSFDVYLVRHFEKQSQKLDPQLTPVGAERAERLAHMSKSFGLKGVYSTDYQRTKQTASPTANANKLKVIPYDPDNLRTFVAQIKGQQKTVLIVGHSNTTPDAIMLLGGQSKPIAESEYGELFKVRFVGETITTTSEMVPVN